MGADFSLKSWQIVAGGRSVAQTSGIQRLSILHPEESVGKIDKCLSLCILSALCVSVVSVFVGKSTTVTQSSQRSHREVEVIPTGPEGVSPVSLTPFQGVGDFRLMSGGLRYAATTGYYLTALQAEAVHLPFEACAIFRYPAATKLTNHAQTEP